MMRTTFFKSAFLIMGFLMATALGPASLAQSTQIVVDSTADAVDSSPGDGKCRTAAGACTLRAAVQEANALAGADTITLPGGNYNLTLTDIGDDDITLNGDLDIRDTITIIGAGQSATMLNGTQSRVFDTWNSAAEVRIAHLTIRNGWPQYGGGGGLFNRTQAILEDVLIADSIADQGGGISNSGNLTLNNVTVSTNETDSFSGGGIYNQGALTLNSSTVIANTATEEGGGISNSNSGFVTLNGSIVRANKTIDGSGGGLHNSGRATLINSSISDNIARSLNGGGGVYNASGTLILDRSTLSGNNTDGRGGAILNVQGGVTLINSTLSANSATIDQGEVGGIYNSNGQLTSTNSTIIDNKSDAGSGGILNNGGSVVLVNTILARNSHASAPNCSGPVISHGYNLIGNTTGCTLATATDDQFGNAGNLIDPKLGPLQNNGGATLTHAPLAGSPVIDAGNPSAVGQGDPTCAATDQIGTSRPQGARCDIGAVELAVSIPAPVLNTLTPASAKAGSAGFPLSVQGANFTNSAIVYWNGAARSTTFVSSTELTAAISASDIRRTGTASVTVANPAPLGGESSPQGFTITPGPAYIPFLLRTLPPRCDSYEPNDDRKVNPTGPIVSGVLLRARICADDAEDNYYFDAHTKTSVQIALSIPPRLVQHLAIGIYAQSALAFPLTSKGCYTNPVTSEQFATSCALPAAGRYIVRMYTTESAFDSTTDYTLQVSYQ